MYATALPADSPSMPFWDLIEESRDEAAFLWRRWESELFSVTRDLDAVWLWTEDRLQGAMDGVRVADTRLLEALSPCLHADDPGQIAFAAHLLANAPAPGGLELLSSHLGDASGPVLDALARGIETASLNGRFAIVARMLAKQGPVHCAILSRIKTFQRAVPGQELDEMYQSSDPVLQGRAMRAAEYLPIDQCTNWVEIGLQHPASTVRLAAIMTGTKRRIAAAWHAAVHCVRVAPTESAPVLKLLAAFGSQSEHQLLIGCLQHESLRPALIQALGVLGTSEAVEVCIECMNDPSLARIAGESYCAITGAELERDKLARPQAAQGDAPITFEADDLDADLVPAAHESWPLPDTDAVTAHWHSLNAGFAANGRYLRGRPCTPNTLLQAVESGPMYWRADHVLELAVRTNGQFDVETRAFRSVQRRMLAATRVHVGT